MRLNRMLAAAGAALMLCGANAAAAAIVTITYSGYVGPAYDQTGVFGPPESLLTGAFTAKFIFDTHNAFDFVDSCVCGPSHGMEAVGTRPDSPSLGAWLTINGDTFALAGDFGDVYTTSYDDGFRDHGATAADLLDETDQDGFGLVTQALLDMYVYGDAMPYGLNVNLDFDVTDEDYVQGFFLVAQHLYVPYGGGVETDTLRLAYGNLITTHYTQTVAGVPEPGAWALMLIGFAGLGGMLRARRARSGQLEAVGAAPSA